MPRKKWPSTLGRYVQCWVTSSFLTHSPYHGSFFPFRVPCNPLRGLPFSSPRASRMAQDVLPRSYLCHMGPRTWLRHGSGPLRRCWTDCSAPILPCNPSRNLARRPRAPKSACNPSRKTEKRPRTRPGPHNLAYFRSFLLPPVLVQETFTLIAVRAEGLELFSLDFMALGLGINVVNMQNRPLFSSVSADYAPSSISFKNLESDLDSDSMSLSLIWVLHVVVSHPPLRNG